ncbi:MAG: hypothetical protein ABII96_03135 [Candidatus Zixiibacteriota bacterium]
MDREKGELRITIGLSSEKLAEGFLKLTKKEARYESLKKIR